MGNWLTGALAVTRPVSRLGPASALGPASGLLLRHQIAALNLRPQRRWESSSASASKNIPPKVPPTLPFVPDVETFLTLIGRDLKQHASKFPSWEVFFSLEPEQIRDLGIEPPRARRYLLEWRQKYREGKYGIGGDFRHVDDGKALLTVVKPEYHLAATPHRKYVVNVPADKKFEDVPNEDRVRVHGYSVKAAQAVVGPYALRVRSGVSQVAVTEGMWEDKRGHKVDGGERRRAEVRFKRRVAERKAMREKRGALY